MKKAIVTTVVLLTAIQTAVSGAASSDETKTPDGKDSFRISVRQELCDSLKLGVQKGNLTFLEAKERLEAYDRANGFQNS